MMTGSCSLLYICKSIVIHMLIQAENLCNYFSHFVIEYHVELALCHCACKTCSWFTRIPSIFYLLL